MEFLASSTPLDDLHYRVTLCGELDLASLETARAAIIDVLGVDRCIEIDFGGIVFMDSTGAYLVDWAERVARRCGADIAVLGLCPAAQRMMSIVRPESRPPSR